MTMKKLLGSAAAVALLAGAAHAQQVAVNGGDFDGIVVALEGGQELSGDLVVTYDLGGAFTGMGAGGEVRLDITLGNASFDGAVPNKSLANDGGSDAGCAFTVNPVLGGGDQGNEVRYVSLVSDGQLNQCAAGSITITLPITVDNFGEPVTFSSTFTATADAGKYGPTVAANIDDTDHIVSYANAITWSLDAGDDADNTLNNLGTAFDPIDPDNGILGTLSVNYDDTLMYDTQNDLANALAGMSDLFDGDGELVVTFTNAADVVLQLDGDACSKSGNVFTCDVDLDDLEAGDLDIVFTIAKDGAVASQTPSAVFNVTADKDANADADAFDGVAATDLARIKRDDGLEDTALASAAFEWVRLGNGSPQSLFRITAGSDEQADAVQSITVSYQAGNTTTGGAFTLMPSASAETGFQINGADITFNSRGITAAIEDAGQFRTGASGGAITITGMSLNHDTAELDAGDAAALRAEHRLVNRNGSERVQVPGINSN